MITLRSVALNDFTSSVGGDTTVGQLCGQGTRKLENTTISSMMLTKGLIIPTEHQHITPGMTNPISIGISIEREATPTPVRETIPNIIAETQVTGKQKRGFVVKLDPFLACPRT